MSILRVMQLGPNFKSPERKHPTDAGCDIHAAEEVTIKPGKRYAVSTHLAVAIPEGCYGRIAPRSGLAFKNGIDVLAGVVDSSFRGEIKVILVNHGDSCFNIEMGDRVAQLIVEKIYTPVIDVVQSLDETDRGKSGFGSTGVK